jgi:sulfoxide reductase heme-binding subunit YedZ
MNAGSMHRKRSGITSLGWINPAVIVGSLAPLAMLLWLALRRQLGANPVAEALNQLGLVALVLLLASLACTPLRILFGWNWPFRLRRTFGLLGFLYAVLHASTYVALDQLGNLRAIWQDVTQRTFIFVGFAALLALIPLAFTSTAASVRRLGSQNWKRLHRLAYVAASLGVIHYVLRVKVDLSEPVIYGVVLAVLFLVRIVKWLRDREPAHPRGAVRAAE